jgi:hypothetical protein
MAQTNTDKNALVDFGANPDAPTPPDIGIALRLSPQSPGSGSRYSPRASVILAGSYRADGALIGASGGNLGASVFLTLRRTDLPSTTTVRLYSPKAVIPSPNDENPPSYGENYREGGQFRVDVKKFFEVADEPARYAVKAKIGTYSSNEVVFEIVK